MHWTEKYIKALRGLLSFFRGFDDSHFRKSYSQEGEDLVVSRLLDGHQSGFFVDIGAHHPTLFSNTYLFYKRGWHGINIDAMPDSMKAFQKVRPRDINLEIPVASTESRLTYYMYNWPALNTFSQSLYEHREKLLLEKDAGYRMIKTIELKTRRLDQILAENIEDGVAIDLLTVDVEDFDLDVLQSNDWDRYRPKVVIAEILESSISSALDNPIAIYLTEKGYTMQSKLVNSCIFTRV